MKRIIIVEDDKFMREELTSIFEKENYSVSCITSFLHTAEDILKETADLVLLDINLPLASGFEICRMVKRKSSIPILVLTSRDQLRDEIHALELGADEYITKPCHKERLLARVENILRRYEDRKQFIERQGIRLDRETYTMYANGKSFVLPENQGIIMELLLQHANDVVTKKMIYHAIWGTTEYIDENAVQVNITRLKKNLENYNLRQKIMTVRGKGYCFMLDGDAQNDE